MSNGTLNGTDGLESRFGEFAAIICRGRHHLLNQNIVVQRLSVSMAEKQLMFPLI